MVRIELTLTIMSFDRLNFVLSGENRRRPLVSYYTNSTFLSATGILLVAV